MKIESFLTGVSLLGLGLLLLRCAGQIPPGGGPVDATPPAIVRTSPDSNATRVQTRTIELEFSKYVDRRSLEESIFISPYLGELEFDWSGTEVAIGFSDSLRKNTTYVVNIGTDVTDLRGRNRMANGFTLAFATGDSIDKGFVSGRIFDEKAEGVMIFAYLLQGLNPDTLNPGHIRPEYIMQTGRDGSFLLSHLLLGTYRVFAVRDEFRNLVYDKEVDAFGVARGDIALTVAHPKMPDIWFRLSKEDTTRPFLASVTAQDRFRMQVRFSEPIDTLTFSKALFTVSDTLGKRQVPVRFAYLLRGNEALAGLVAAAPLDSTMYRLTVANVRDRSGNGIDPTHSSFVFEGSNAPDTLKPRFTVAALRDSARGYPLEEPIDINFSEPVNRTSAAAGITLNDSTGKPVEAVHRWYGPTDFGIVPRRSLLSRAWYKIVIRLDSVVDLAGNRYKDSTFTLRFQTLDLRTTGMIAGTVTDERQEVQGGPIYLTASSVDAMPIRQQTLRMERSGKFSFDRLVEGKYVLSAFIDADSSGTYSYGSPSPFVPSERFAVYADTVKVRARWGVEGVPVKFK